MKNNVTRAVRVGSGILALMLLLSAFLFAQVSAATGTDQLSVLRVEFVNQQPDPVEPGSYVDLRWRITNLGGKAADYVFELQPDYPFTIDNANDALVTTASVTGYQATEEGAILFYRVRVAADAVEGSTNEVKLQYYRADRTGQKSLVEQPVRIESRQGLVNIENVKVSPSAVGIGTVFTTSLDIENFGTNFISQVKVTLDTEGTGLVPYGGSNQRSIARMSGSSVETFSFQFFVDPSAEIQVVSVPVEVTYYDSLGRENTVSTTIGIKIDASPSFFPNLDKSAVFMADAKGQITVSISNTGKSDINFAVLELIETADYVVVGPATSYLGNLKSDDLQTGQFDVYVKPTSAASVPLKFKLTYKDAYDQLQTEEFTLANRLYDEALAKKVGLVPASSFGGTAFVIVLVVLAGAYFWYRRRKKAAVKSTKN